MLLERPGARGGSRAASPEAPSLVDAVPVPRRAVAVLLASLSLSLAAAGCSKPKGDGDAVYSTKGVVKSIAADKSSATIQHEDIPGYMKAMTMTFQSKAPAQLEGLAAGDKVSISFVDDAKHTLVEVKKQ